MKVAIRVSDQAEMYFFYLGETEGPTPKNAGPFIVLPKFPLSMLMTYHALDDFDAFAREAKVYDNLELKTFEKFRTAIQEEDYKTIDRIRNDSFGIKGRLHEPAI